jgi:hypothetical protein
MVSARYRVRQVGGLTNVREAGWTSETEVALAGLGPVDARLRELSPLHMANSRNGPAQQAAMTARNPMTLLQPTPEASRRHWSCSHCSLGHEDMIRSGTGW